VPGAAFTTATVEPACGDVVAGESRLVFGSVQLLLLAFGIVAAVEFAGLPSQAMLHDGARADPSDSALVKVADELAVTAQPVQKNPTDPALPTITSRRMFWLRWNRLGGSRKAVVRARHSRLECGRRRPSRAS
jgi:hypothetical protein